MSQLDFQTIQLIVENNLREAGLEGNLETGWKDTLVVNNTTYTQPFNLQSLRDVIAKSIVDAMTNATVSGNISSGNETGIPIVVEDESEINITIDNNVASKNAARVGDSVGIDITSDQNFLSWVQQVSYTLNALADGSITTVPSSVSGIIVSGSSTVFIGD